MPNLTAWRRGFTAAPKTAFPSPPSLSRGDAPVAQQAVLNALTGTLDVGIPYPIPSSNSLPKHEAAPARSVVPQAARRAP